MRDAAACAAMSDPDLNRHFRRRWLDLHPPTGVTPQSSRQDREADALLQLGFHLQAEHLARRADKLRGVPA